MIEPNYSSVLDQAPVGIVYLDLQGNFDYINKFGRRILGYQGSVTESFKQFIYDEDRHIFESQLFSRESNPVGCVFTCRFITRDKDTGILKIKLQPDRLNKDRYILFFEDFTDQHTGVARLKQAKEVAERATKTKSAFLANMSHEIRTPIHTIRAMMELLADTPLDEEQQDYVSQVRFSADVLLSLINDILDFSKIEAGKLMLEEIEFDLHNMLEEAIDLVSLQAHQKGLESIIHIMPGVPRFVIGDPARIRQIIINLFNNAVKFTSKGEVVLRVFPGPIKDGVMTIRYEVSDTGIGIPTPKLTTLFKPFTQVDSSTTRKFGGTGLGLSICRSLVSMMKGRIGIKSQVSKGSTFWFSLPMPLDVALDDEKKIESTILEGRTVLLVDDNVHSRYAISDYLSRWGAEVDTASNGKEGLEKMRKSPRPFDAVLVDFLMPNMDGWQLASEVNNDKGINENRLILMNPNGVSVEAKMKLLRWFNAYINKPIRRGRLIGSILQVLGEDVDLSYDTESAEKASTWSGSTDYTILIAEDHFINQQLFKTILDKMGFRSLLANNGREAVDAALKETVDLIFMDIQMPELNGYEATIELREKGFKGPIIAVTANAFKGEQDRCIEVGMDDYLTKPFTQPDLIAKMKVWLPEKEIVEQPESEDDAEDLIPEPEDVGDVDELISEYDSVSDNKDETMEAVQELDTVTPESEQAAEKQDTGEQGIFDYEAAVQVFMGNHEVVLRLLGMLGDKLDLQIQAIDEALENEDYHTIEREAHGIKGGSWNIKAKLLGDAAMIVEDQCREGNLDNLIENINKIKQEKSRFTKYIKEKGYID